MASHNSCNLSICSFNVRGLQNNDKRRQFFTWLRSQPFDICFLQETHCVPGIEKIWTSEWGYKIHFNHFSSKSAGVCILFKATFQFDVLNTRFDPRGRILLLNTRINGDTVSLVNIYAPNNDDPGFFIELSQMIGSYAEGFIILGGDFNIVQDFEFDKMRGRLHTNFLAKKELLALKENLDLIDIWREKKSFIETLYMEI